METGIINGTIQGQAALMARTAQKTSGLVGFPWLDLIMLFGPLLLELLNCADDDPTPETARKVKRLVSLTHRNGKHNAFILSAASSAASRVAKAELDKELTDEQARAAAVIALDRVLNAEEETVKLVCADGYKMLAARAA